MALDTNMLMYMLAGTGAQLGGEGSTAQAVGQMTQGAIQTQNYSKMLQAMLAGGGKMNMDKENMSFKVPTGFFKGGGEKGLQLPGAAEGLERIQNITPGGGTTPLPANNVGTPMTPQGGALNPFLLS